MNKQPLPELGKRYHFFEDGKSGPSRHYIVEITKVVPRRRMKDEDILANWRAEVNGCDWLYDKKTDYFVFGKIVLTPTELDSEEFIFARTQDGGWFSFSNGFWDGELDVDSSKYNEIIKDWPDYDSRAGTEGLMNVT